MAAAIELGLKPGRMIRGCSCGCINLLQTYPHGCAANCSYCGLARERPGLAEDNTFIRVSWPRKSAAFAGSDTSGENVVEAMSFQNSIFRLGKSPAVDSVSSCAMVNPPGCHPLRLSASSGPLTAPGRRK